MSKTDIRARTPRPLPPLQAEDERVYAQLTRREHARPEDEDSINRLREHRLIAHDPHSPGVPLTLDPRMARQQTVAEAHARITEELATLRDLQAVYERMASIYSQESAAGGGVRLLDTPELANAAIGRSMSRLSTALYTAQPTQRPPQVLEASRQRDGELLRRGVKMYTIYPQSARTREPEIQWAEEMSGLGAEIRTSAQPFMRMIIIDGVAAYLEEPAADDHSGADGPRPAIEFTHPSAVVWVKSLYMLWWCLAQPWTGARAREAVTEGTFTTARERAILRLMDAGCSRAQIARDLDLGERTITGTIAELKAKFQAESLFELGSRWRAHAEYDLP